MGDEVDYSGTDVITIPVGDIIGSSGSFEVGGASAQLVKGKKGLLELYWPKCGFCVQAYSLVKFLAKELKKYDFVIVAVDVSKESGVIPTTGVPHFYFLDNGKLVDSETLNSSDRTISGFLEHISKFMSMTCSSDDSSITCSSSQGGGARHHHKRRSSRRSRSKSHHRRRKSHRISSRHRSRKAALARRKYYMRKRA
jgi:hypothetical protein